MKKIIVIAVVVVLALSLFTGCAPKVEQKLPVGIWDSYLIEDFTAEGYSDRTEFLSVAIEVNEDGTGQYKQKTGGYLLSFPITVEGNKLIPEVSENELGITDCELKFSSAENLLVLHVTEKAEDGSYLSFKASCIKATEEKQNVSQQLEDEYCFEWHGHIMRVEATQDDGSIIDKDTEPEGKYVNVTIKCIDGTLTYDEVNSYYTEVILLDKNEYFYYAVNTGYIFSVDEFLNLYDVRSCNFVALMPVFDIPTDSSVKDFVLYIPDVMEISLKNVPMNVSDIEYDDDKITGEDF